MKRTFVVEIEDALKGAEDDIEELERKWGAEEIEHKCRNCKHYSKGDFDGSCGSYICKNYSGWERRRVKMADIELVIKISEEAKQAFDCAESNDLKGCYYDHGGVIGNAIREGTQLPKGHGALKDVSQIEIPIFEDRAYERWVQVAINAAPTIIEADKEESEE